jgi:hypothetical protein
MNLLTTAPCPSPQVRWEYAVLDEGHIIATPRHRLRVLPSGCALHVG